MEKMQFCAVLLLSLLTLTLAFMLPRRVVTNPVANRSRWLMAGGTALLALQFLLQYNLHLRDMGVTQAVMLNLLLFIPSSWLLSMSVLYLQRQGNVNKRDWLIGPGVWLFVSLLLLGANIIDGQPLLSDTPELWWAEVIGSVFYTTLQLHYTYCLNAETRRISKALDNYYDHTKDGLLQWMRHSIVVLTVMGTFAPLLIFGHGWPLAAYALFFFVGLYYMVICFLCFLVSNDSRQVMVAEQSALEDNKKRPVTPNGSVLTVDACSSTTSTGSDDSLSSSDKQRVDYAVSQWTAQNRHLRSGITIQTAADEMHIPRYLLTLWLKTTQHELFNPWLTHLRIEAAKRLLTEHPDWSNDTIAEQCGFSTRNYFQTVFKKQTGMTPTQFIESSH